MSNTLKPGRVFVYLDGEPIGIGWVRDDGKIDMHLPGEIEELDGKRIMWLQEDEYGDDWNEFYRGYDDDAECDLCGGEGFREYYDAPDEWGEDCPSEANHLIPCRGCEEVERAKLQAFAAFLLRRLREGRKSWTRTES